MNIGRELFRLVGHMSDMSVNMPCDDLSPGFVLLDETRTELHECLQLLQNAAQLFQQALNRETPRYDAYEEALMPKSNVVPIRR